MSRMAPTKPTVASSLAPAVWPAVVAGLLGAAVLFVFAGPLSFSAGLVVVALFVGRIVGQATRAGGAGVEPAARTSVAIVVSLVAITVGLLGAWGAAVAEGGSLGPVDYLAATLGPLVPLQYIVATLAAWWSTR
jgi:hypothetical protein